MNFFRSVFSTDPDDEEGEGENAASPDHDEPDETAAAASAAAAATMDFFKSVFSASPDPPEEEEEEEGDEGEVEEREPLNREQDQESGEVEEGAEDERGEEEEEEGVSAGAWGLGFGGLIKTIASRSETVIKDLEEFGHGLKAESVVLRDVASRALDVGASAAQEKLESMGQAVDDIGDTIRQGTVELISQSKEALLTLDSPSPSSESPSDSESNPRPLSATSSLPIISRYTRFEAQLIAARSDPATFAEPPEDPEDFAKWQSGFKLEERKDEIDALLKDNSQVEVFLEKLVPSLVDEETFWSRYFYKIGKIKQAEDARAKIVKMAVAGDEEEDLSWEVEEEEEEQEKENVEEKEMVQKEEEKKDSVREPDTHDETEVQDVKSGASQGVEEKETVETSKEESNGDSNGESNGEEMTSKSSDFSVISSRPSVPGEEEEDLGWEAIEEVDESEDKKPGLGDASASSGPSSGAKADDLRKRLSATVDEEEEELSWDIEDE